jgi:hypothetical protein
MTNGDLPLPVLVDDDGDWILDSYLVAAENYDEKQFQLIKNMILGTAIDVAVNPHPTYARIPQYAQV